MINFEPTIQQVKKQRQREIELDQSWWKDRFTYEGHYYWPYMQLSYQTFYTTLFNYWWKHHQLQLGPLVIEWKTRRRKLS